MPEGSRRDCGSGLVASLARPGGNLTGLSLLATPGMSGKRLELLKELVPKLSRVAILWNPDNRAKVVELNDAELAARALGVTLRPVAVRGADDFDRAFSAIVKERADALVTFADAVTLLHRGRIADFATKRRLPMITEQRAFAEVGGLMTYGERTSRTCSAEPRRTWTRFSKAPNRPTCRWSSRRSSSW